ncbi:hypothetical protein AQUCO_00300334v1 [Aquilegia coerulea]|uniref:Uncharacterized protein n=1 Tax=Aquilegia coerulea TaxID=218851 RepID=A0A2G5EYM7_AQUCA|nr:hypothetical protein AQUCO_00300334v1 [Aquilegia coerulea]
MKTERVVSPGICSFFTTPLFPSLPFWFIKLIDKCISPEREENGTAQVFYHNYSLLKGCKSVTHELETFFFLRFLDIPPI